MCRCRINALLLLQAAAIDAAIARGEAAGPLAGVPIAIKVGLNSRVEASWLGQIRLIQRLQQVVIPAQQCKFRDGWQLALSLQSSRCQAGNASICSNNRPR